MLSFWITLSLARLRHHGSHRFLLVLRCVQVMFEAFMKIEGYSSGGEASMGMGIINEMCEGGRRGSAPTKP